MLRWQGWPHVVVAMVVVSGRLEQWWLLRGGVFVGGKSGWCVFFVFRNAVFGRSPKFSFRQCLWV